MNVSSVKYLPRPFAINAILAFIVVFSLCSILFQQAQLPWLWSLFAFIEVIAFFYFVNTTGRSWASISVSGFIRKLFWVSLTLRVIWVVFSYFFFIAHTGIPFDFIAADSYSYHTWALDASDSFSEKGFGQFFRSRMGYSDLGYPMYLTVVYLIFGNSVIIARLLFAIWSAWTSVLIYKLARRNFGESTGRIAGIMAMLLPNFIYYTGLHLKEPLMVFLIVAFIERVDCLFREKQVKATNLFIISLLGVSLFFFRTMLGLSAFFAVFSALILSKKMNVNWVNRVLLGFWVIAVFGLFLSARILEEINYLIENRDMQEANMQWRAAREDGNTLATYGRTNVFLPFMFIAPFPTFINIDFQEQQMLLSGAYFIKNVYAFFVILALILMFKRKLLRKHVLLLTFVGSYILILAMSSFAISERFHMPVVPFLLIVAAYGISQLNIKNKKYYIPYLVLIIIIVIGWNWFKLAGRGVV
jgi:4-amino-4-deoxy-L-arabinose transferase-like glycosyltransferase